MRSFLVFSKTPKSSVRIKRRFREKPYDATVRLYTAVQRRARRLGRESESERVTALGATAGKDAAAALRAAADKEAVRTGTLDLGGLVSTFRSHSSNLN